MPSPDTNYYLQATQRLSDGWRSVMGSSAMAIVNAFFNATDEYRNSDKMRQEFADASLDQFRFIYRSAKGKDRRVSTLS